jgi:nucleoside-diphosphate-sugar epimerase
MNVASPSETSRGRVLITGLNGFTGKYLAVELGRRGYEVHGTVAAHVAGSAQRDRLHVADLLAPATLHRVMLQVQPAYVVHLAAIAFVAHGDARDMYLTNIVGTRNLLEAAAQTNAGRLRNLLLASSANIYGNALADPIDETQPPNPANDYAVSKLAMEHMAQLWRDRLPITIARPFNYTGVGQSESFLLPKIVAAVRQRLPTLELGNTHVERDFCDVRDVVMAYGGILDKPAGGVLNICSGQTYSLSEVVQIAQNLAGHALEIRMNPAFVRANEVHRLRGSAERLRSVLGTWNPRPIRETLAWMLGDQAPAELRNGS